MKTIQTRWSPESRWGNFERNHIAEEAQLVFLFGGTSTLKQRELIDEVKGFFPKAHLLGCSTAGEIYDTEVTDDLLVATAVLFEHSTVEGTSLQIDTMEDSFNIGEKLAQSLAQDKLVHVFVLSDGLKVNGSELVKGLTKHLPENVTVTGGLAGDGARFAETFVLWDDMPKSDTVAILGLYGGKLKVGYASLGGWDSFGPDRLITRSKGNILYELDGKSALDLYKSYLGEHAAGLPATGLLFPLSLRRNGDETGVVRTILATDEEEQSMTFAGDVPEGSYARLMKANFDHLVDGAVGAAKTSYEAIGSTSPELAILISCVGRKLVLKQRIEEEVEGVRDILGDETTLTGFYSYGEISPFTPKAKCELHNQTMTITTFSERYK